MCINGGSDMCIIDQLDSISADITHSYKRIFGDDIVEILLYGSYARGDFDDESDIDITAIVRGDRIDLQEKLRDVWSDAADIGLEHDVVISPTVIPEDEYNRYKTILPYYRNIMEEGKRIG